MRLLDVFISTFLSSLLIALAMLEAPLFADERRAVDEFPLSGKDPVFESFAEELFADPELEATSRVDETQLSESADPFHKIATAMRRVTARLTAEDSSKATQDLQLRIIADLDELLARLQERTESRGAATAKGELAPGDGSPTLAPGPGPESAAATSSNPGSSNSPASQATSQTGPTLPLELTRAEQDRLLEQAWGDLPATARQQLRSARPETFLPKYSRLIEAYYRKLAEPTEATSPGTER